MIAPGLLCGRGLQVREKQFHNRVFDSPEVLEDHPETALRNFELDHQCTSDSIAFEDEVFL